MNKKNILVSIAIVVVILIGVFLFKTTSFLKNPQEAIEKHVNNMTPEEKQVFEKTFNDAMRETGEKCKTKQSWNFKTAEKINSCNKFTTIPFNSFTHSYRMQEMTDDNCLIEKEKIKLGVKPEFEVIATCNVPKETLNEMYKLFLEYTEKMCDESVETSKLNQNLKKMEDLISNHCANK